MERLCYRVLLVVGRTNAIVVGCSIEMQRSISHLWRVLVAGAHLAGCQPKTVREQNGIARFAAGRNARKPSDAVRKRRHGQVDDDLHSSGLNRPARSGRSSGRCRGLPFLRDHCPAHFTVYGSCALRTLFGVVLPTFTRMGSRSLPLPVYFTWPFMFTSRVEY